MIRLANAVAQPIAGAVGAGSCAGGPAGRNSYLFPGLVVSVDVLHVVTVGRRLRSRRVAGGDRGGRLIRAADVVLG